MSAAVAIEQSFFTNYFSTITDAEKNLYLALAYHATLAKSTEVQVPQVRLERFTGLSHTTISQSRNALRHLNLIQIVGAPARNSPTIYRVELLANVNNPELVSKTPKVNLTERPALESKVFNKAFEIWGPMVEERCRQAGHGFVRATNSFDQFYREFMPKVQALSDNELITFNQHNRSPIIREILKQILEKWK